MTLRRKLRVAQWALVAIAAAIIVTAALELRLGLAWIVAFVVLGAFVPARGRLYRWIAHRAQRRVTALGDAGRYADARALLGELRGIYAHTPSVVEQMRLREATTFLVEGRFAEALRLY
ncbi:MAG TPA: hypothetical protein VGH87_25475, partial [Polyangiaceae bacterium]